MKYRRFIVTLFVSIAVKSFSQDTLKLATEIVEDSNTVKILLLNSKLDFHARTLFMSTINDGVLKDDYALASGFGLGLSTKAIYGIQFGVGAFVVYNLWSSQLAELDSATLTTNRYEVGLFDIQNLNAKYNLIRLENLFLKYTFSKTTLTVGKIKLNTPFLNPQDGRMNTTVEEGIWLSINEFKKVQFNGGWIWNISPRSTTRWYNTANSIGIYAIGVTEQGTTSNYYGNVGSSGVGIANVLITPNKHAKINIWDVVFDNVMNTSMIEINTEFGSGLKFYQGFMFIHQDAVSNGGNLDQSKSYMSKNSQSNTFSGQIGIKNKNSNTTINYTHITGDGRYLMPREWGKEPFYTILPRERNEGFGNVHAAAIKTTFNFLKGNLKTGLAYGYFLLPDVKDYRINKYGIPSYQQFNIDMSYSFTKFLKGLDIKFITAYKQKQGETYNNLKYIHNKVNLANINVILDFKI